MLGVACVAGSVRHRQDHTRAYGACDLNGLLNLLVRRTELLRTCEVRHCSRLAMQRQDQGEVHQLLSLGVQRSSVVGLLEVICVGLARVEVPLAWIRHANRLLRPAKLAPGLFAEEMAEGSEMLTFSRAKFKDGDREILGNSKRTTVDTALGTFDSLDVTCTWPATCRTSESTRGVTGH